MQEKCLQDLVRHSSTSAPDTNEHAAVEAEEVKVVDRRDSPYGNRRVIQMQGRLYEVPKMVYVSSQRVKRGLSTSLSLTLTLPEFGVHSEISDEVAGDFAVSGKTPKGTAHLLHTQTVTMENVLKFRCADIVLLVAVDVR